MIPNHTRTGGSVSSSVSGAGPSDSSDMQIYNQFSFGSSSSATAAARRALKSSPQPRAVAGEPAFASLRCLPKNNNDLFPSLVETSILPISDCKQSSLRVNHLRTQCASQVLLTAVARAGEGIMVSPAHPMCPTGTSDRGHPRR